MTPGPAPMRLGTTPFIPPPPICAARRLHDAGSTTLKLIGFALLNSPAVKPRLQELARKAKEQMEERRAGRMAVDASTDEASTMVDPSGFDAPIADVLSTEPNGSVAIPIEPDVYRTTPETSRS